VGEGRGLCGAVGGTPLGLQREYVRMNECWEAIDLEGPSLDTLQRWNVVVGTFPPSRMPASIEFSIMLFVCLFGMWWSACRTPTDWGVDSPHTLSGEGW
jgi:hypothetical protein